MTTNNKTKTRCTKLWSDVTDKANNKVECSVPCYVVLAAAFCASNSSNAAIRSLSVTGCPSNFFKFGKRFNTCLRDSVSDKPS